MGKPTLIAVLAGNRRQFEEFLDFMRYSPEDKRKFVYIESDHRVRGLEITDVIRIGSFDRMSRYHRQLYDFIMMYIEAKSNHEGNNNDT